VLYDAFFPLRNIPVDDDSSTIDRRASNSASAFGSLIRSRRKALDMRQDQLALATGVGRRFLIELEAGKPSCQLGRSLLVAEALGLRPADILAAGVTLQAAGAAELPDLPEQDLPEEVEEPDGRSAGIF
jgi:transcriptional regulator with XRE-family HTH domain